MQGCSSAIVNFFLAGKHCRQWPRRIYLSNWRYSEFSTGVPVTAATRRMTLPTPAASRHSGPHLWSRATSQMLEPPVQCACGPRLVCVCALTRPSHPRVSKSAPRRERNNKDKQSHRLSFCCHVQWIHEMNSPAGWVPHQQVLEVRLSLTTCSKEPSACSPPAS